jgi:hypothetical protein
MLAIQAFLFFSLLIFLSRPTNTKEIKAWTKENEEKEKD